MADIKQQWKKRVEIFKCIYSDLINDDKEDIKKIAFSHYSFDKNQMSIIEYYAEHKDELEKEIIKNLSHEWRWDRIPVVEKAILLSSVAESLVQKIDKSIVIDQALVTVSHYGSPASKKYINAILDKVIK